MPKDDPPLPAAEIALIARWIDEGVRETPTGAPAPAPWWRRSRSIARPSPARSGPGGRHRPIASSPITCAATVRHDLR